MPHGGVMLRNKMHVHNKVFKEYFLIRATPDELGLNAANGMVTRKAFEVIDIKKLGYQSLDEVKDFVLHNLKVSQQVFMNCYNIICYFFKLF